MNEYLTKERITNIKEHLKDRGINIDNNKYVIVDEENIYASFLLFNLSGQLVGYQNYNPNANKVFHQKSGMAKAMHTEDLLKVMRYFTCVTKVGKVDELAVYGLHTIKNYHKYFFITEGIFDINKIHNQELPGISVLSCNPKKLKSWLSILPQKKIIICDNDNAGRKLAELGDLSFFVPEKFKDLGDMTDEQIFNFLNTEDFKLL